MRSIAISCLLVLVSSAAHAKPRARVTLDRGRSGPPTGSVCNTGQIRCFAHVRVDGAGEIQSFGASSGWGPADLQAAYEIDPNIATTPVVAIVDAYGYSNIDADLATYRAQFGLPPCTKQSGCLKVVNQDGQTTGLPPDPPSTDDWTLETALDVDMVSAACPKCKIVVVQANSTSLSDLLTAQQAAAALRPTVISDSWGGPEGGDMTAAEQYLDFPGIAEFVSAGDNGYDHEGQGPDWPATSGKVIAVGGTALYPASNARGFTENAWSSGGSACSLSIPKPAYQGNTGCTKRATTDISAVGDPATGVIIYNAANGGYLVIGGTSAAAPLVASMFAGIGRGDVTAAQIAQSTAALHDVTSGSNGNCGTILCNAGAGWDGPTGYGTPNVAALAGGNGDPPPPPPGGLSVKITSPAQGSTVMEGFQITADVSGAVVVGAFIDGTLVAKTTTAPYAFQAPNLLPGPHLVQVAALDSANNEMDDGVQVTVADAGPPPAPGGGGGGGGHDNGDGGGCAAAPGASPFLVVALLALRRRRR
jgi:uncharacterized protein (TIGR03382 family)